MEHIKNIRLTAYTSISIVRQNIVRSDFLVEHNAMEVSRLYDFLSNKTCYFPYFLSGYISYFSHQLNFGSLVVYRKKLLIMKFIFHFNSECFVTNYCRSTNIKTVQNKRSLSMEDIDENVLLNSNTFEIHFPYNLR